MASLMEMFIAAKLHTTQARFNSQHLQTEFHEFYLQIANLLSFPYYGGNIQMIQNSEQ
jgi:hypothetical protein